MSRCSIFDRGIRMASLAVVLLVAQGAQATNYDQAREALQEGNCDAAIRLLTGVLDEHPGHTSARILLGQSYEKCQKWEEAESVWEDILAISRSDDLLGVARKSLIRLRRRNVEEQDIALMRSGDFSARSDGRDPFDIPMPEVPWDEVGEVESTDYENGFPPFHFASQHFDVYATNEKLAEVIAEHSEIYLAFMSEHLFGNRAWPHRIPIKCYATFDDYVSVGGAPPGTGGVTSYSPHLGTTFQVLFFHRTEIEEEVGRRRKRDVPFKYSVESVLPHELTHVMINEFFGGQKVPQWLHEAVAGRMELTRDHYLEAARLARAVVAGEHFRFRDLFEQEGYPSSRIGLFYEQSAIIVLYLFEAGPEAMYAFFSELAQQKTHDEALSAALGIPVEGAVEEFERMWVEWMKRRYVMDLKPDPGEKVEIDLAEALEDNTFDPPVDEVGAFAAISDWRTVPTDSLSKHYCGVGATLEDWKVSGGSVHGHPPEDGFGGAYLGIRMYEKLPLAVRCTVRSDGEGWAGFALLNSSKNETGIEVLGRVEDGRSHELIALLSDELAIYVDGICTGRYPRPTQDRLDAAIDFPLALVAYSPLEITNLEVAHIDKFELAEPDEDDDSNRGRSNSRRGGGGGRRGR